MTIKSEQLNKLIDVVKVMEMSDYEHIERELMFVKVAATNMESCASIKRMADIFRAREPVPHPNDVTGADSATQVKAYGADVIYMSGHCAIVRFLKTHLQGG